MQREFGFEVNSIPQWREFGVYSIPQWREFGVYSILQWGEFGVYSIPQWGEFGVYSIPQWGEFGIYSILQWGEFRVTIIRTCITESSFFPVINSFSPRFPGFSSPKKVDEPSEEMTQQPQKVIPNFMLLARDLNIFTHLLSVEDARVMVDLLKLAVAKRVGERGKETLAAVLTTMAKTNKEVQFSECC